MATEEQTIAPPDPQTPDTGGPVLPEQHRKKLDIIVSKMHDNGESDEAIHAVVDDFKKKYSAAPASSEKPATDKLKEFQDQQRRASTEPGFKPGVMPLPQMTPEKVKEFNDKITQNVQQHAKEVTQARENLKKIHDNITPVAQAALKEDLEKDALSKGQAKLQQIGSDATRVNGVPLPGDFPKAPDVTPDMLQKYKDNPENRDYLMHKQLDAYKKAGDTKAANKLQSDLYLNDAAERTAAAGKEGVAVNNAERLKKGELQYSPISKTLIEPTGFTASIAEGQANRVKDRALFNLADRGDKEALMKQLDEEIQHDPDEPVKVPKNLVAHIGSFAGEQGIPGLATAAAELIPGIGQAAGAGIQSEEMATRGFSGELRKTYADLVAKGMPKEEALDKALTQAKSAMVIDAATGAILGKGIGKVAAKVAKPAAENMLKGAIVKALGHIKEEVPASLINAGIFSGAQVAKNATANAVGDERSLGEGALEAGGMALLLHHSVGLISKGLYESPGIMKRLLQGTSKAPITELKGISDNLVQDGVITPEEAQKGLTAIEEHKALDAQVPEKVKNDEVRLDLQKKIKRRQDLEEELKTVNKAFHPEVKEKIAALDETMNEIANSDEAKQETPAPEIKPINNEQATSGERGTFPSTEKQVEPPIGSTQPGSRSRRNRAQEVRSEENGGIISARAKEIGVNPEHISVFSDLEDAGAKKGEKARTNSIKRIEEDYGSVKEKADYINDNFSNIEKKLISSKVIKKICP